MKPWPLLIGIIVILALICSPVLAISKSDLISSYKGQFIPTPMPTPTPTPQIPSDVIEPVHGVGSISVISEPSGANVYLDGTFKGTTPLTINGLPIVSYRPPGGTLFTITVTKKGYKENCTYVYLLMGELRTVSVILTPTILTPSWYTGQVIPTQKPTLKPPTTLSPKPFINPYMPDIPSKKPNIYLYSDRDLTAQVLLTPEKAITVSEPVYQPGMGWQAEIWNGSLNGAGDFLFYEAIVPDAGWQKEEGYVIRAAYREKDMSSMLGPYGFNEKETAEFIEYWASHLVGDVDYVFYPQETDAVEQVMPLSVSPKPDHVMRIWFYAEPLITAPEPVTHPEKIVREGFYVVEWGVMIEDTGKILG